MAAAESLLEKQAEAKQGFLALSCLLLFCYNASLGWNLYVLNVYDAFKALPCLLMSAFVCFMLPPLVWTRNVLNVHAPFE